MARGGFRGGYGGMNQANMMKQAQKMQQDFLRMQKELEEKEFTAKAGGGMVTAVVNGNREVTKIEIKPEAVDPDDVEMLEDLVLAAVNEALRLFLRGSGSGCGGTASRGHRSRSSATNSRLKKMIGTFLLSARSVIVVGSVRSTRLTHTTSQPLSIRLFTCSFCARGQILPRSHRLSFL